MGPLHEFIIILLNYRKDHSNDAIHILPREKNSKHQFQPKNNMVSIFWDRTGVLVDFMPEGKIITAEGEILRHL